jgi:hypothetical protein
MPSSQVPIIEVNVRIAGSSMDAVAKRVIALLEAGTVRVIDFTGDIDEETTIRAVGYPGGDDAT